MALKPTIPNNPPSVMHSPPLETDNVANEDNISSSEMHSPSPQADNQVDPASHDGPGVGWLTAAHSGDPGIGNWGSTTGWGEPQNDHWGSNAPNSDDHSLPNDRPGHLDSKDSSTWARLQLHACSIVAQRSDAAFPTFTGPQIESRIASIEEELATRRLERDIRADKANDLLKAHYQALDECRDIDRSLGKLEETLNMLQDLRFIALTFFPPPALPPEPRVNQHIMSSSGHDGSSTQPPPDAGSLTRSHVLNNMRSDFNEKGLTWAGRENRDTSLDILDVTFWASIQLYRCSEKARLQRASSPTFTGAQVQERLIEIDAKIKAKKRRITAAAKIHAAHQSRAQKSKKKLEQEEQELEEYELTLAELRDLELITWGLSLN
ncbi:hypothetical protein BT96DRAFT_1009323 [Gymnopus androsaceus JB14]|uniref:Uncharacterized protein n=1 Tax=Gymnopus androsaceus JB14 TaxID=1447944 RepID=A0A6A4GD22_9AGAR|nr:hypothetical protein BT96DRAFT_1009323 [Gymnopus androsaceus JB14]